MRLLVVDDSAVTRAMIKRTVAAAGLPVAEVDEASDGQAAIRSLAMRGADVLITDLNMPGMGGVDLVRAVRADPVLAAIAVVVVSTDGSPARRAMLSSLGVAGYLAKPFRPEDLRRVLSGVIAGLGGAA